MMFVLGLQVVQLGINVVGVAKPFSSNFTLRSGVYLNKFRSSHASGDVLSFLMRGAQNNKPPPIQGYYYDTLKPSNTCSRFADRSVRHSQLSESKPS